MHQSKWREKNMSDRNRDWKSLHKYEMQLSEWNNDKKEMKHTIIMQQIFKNPANMYPSHVLPFKCITKMISDILRCLC